MKKFLIALVLLTAHSVLAQTADDKEALRRARESSVTFYHRGKYDEALEFARQALDLNIKIHGAAARETAVAYNNLGMIYRAKEKYKDAAENLQKSIDVYQKIPDYKGKEIITTYESLAAVQSADGKEKQAETSYLKALQNAETVFGKESRESLSPTIGLAKLYAREENFDQSDAFFLRAYALALKIFGAKAKEIEQLDDIRICSTSGLGAKLSKERQKSFSDAKAKILGLDVDNTKSGVITGRAISLPQPEYPLLAKQLRLSGTVPIKVLIDAEGNVVKADSICRQDILGLAAVQAAKQAKFSPTALNGEPVQVTGIIIYNFSL